MTEEEPIYIESLKVVYLNDSIVSTETTHTITLPASKTRVAIGSASTRGPVTILVRSNNSGGANGYYILVRTSASVKAGVNNDFGALPGVNNEMVSFEWEAGTALSMYHSTIPSDGLTKEYTVIVNSPDGSF